MRVLKRSAWASGEIEAFLGDTRLPLRVACLGANGYPLINSVWFRYAEDALWCAVLRTSVLAVRLTEDPRCAFELAPDTPPYHGVRGQAQATVLPERGGPELERLIERYLGDRDKPLASWLLSRSNEEVALRLAPTWISAWDFRHRMSAPD